MTTLSWIRGVNGTLGHLAPETVAGRMRRAFMTPRNLPPRQWELPLLATAERITLRFGLSALRWGKGPTVLLMHGWEGRPTQFAALIDTLVRAGHTVVSLEGPAHGRSPGQQAHVVLFARALLEAAAELPPLRAVIGHSMGGASVLLALQWGLRTEAAVSIAAPAQLLGVLRGFARRLGLPARARAAFIRQVEQDVGVQVARLDVSGYQLELPGLVVHASDDRLVPASEAQLIHKAWFDSRLMVLEEGGHQRVLADPRLGDAVLELLARAPRPARQSA
ncbi:alpha/beta fold hydrolase [Pseudomonas guariconensis]|uniref:alpha/beta fold hydrolase n=1 Tax=Pseudomonas TaxID=286 RepID=UPI001CE3C92E|nr:MULTISPECIES: alpha/beta fold hydrolase [Pseudomonas]MCO7514857.1 alpha/beta fold hydrolase [Pseudomonas putida]MCO7594088.1 alpha/beta fold hydrolase [Pseudomonas guariconensis]MCO7605292.1 alpha/beta fold hydrolase [Pseudomonas guariconensis]MCO7630432.1 alpha/beta fold hydrolase [Pseudomonas guariconensis]MCU7220184.1 alpha/beta fold hydrolase [Pseudomonas brassicacearum]